MYVIELLIKKFLKKHSTKISKTNKSVENLPDYEKCNHVFMPIDSTGKIFACTKCGEILKK